VDDESFWKRELDQSFAISQFLSSFGTASKQQTLLTAAAICYSRGSNHPVKI